MSSTPFQTVTILSDGSFKVKVLRRKPENENKNATLLASKGAEIKLPNPPLLVAAKEANVKRFIPSEFGSKWEVIEDREMAQRLQNKDDSVPSTLDEFKFLIQKYGSLDRVDNDKFSFKSRPISEVTDSLVKQA
ncbi:16660_t:CDS:2, partial [Acaulospora colombiana]